MKVNLATTETVSANYAGEFAGRYISAAVLSADSFENGAVSVQPGIPYKWNIPKMSLSGLVADSTCDFTPVGTLTLADRVLTVEEFEVNLKLCKKTYRPTWESLSMGVSAHDNLPKNFSDYLIGLAGASVAADRETVVWQGVNATAGHFDGFETLFTSQATQPSGQEIAGTTVTAANVVAQMALVLDAAPSAVYSAPGFAIKVGTNIARHYIQAQAALGYMDKFNVDQTPMNFLGVPIQVCPGMSDDVMFATYEDNLWYGIGQFSDMTQVNLIDQSTVDGSNNVHLVMQWADGAQVGVVEDVVTYGITNAAN